MSTFNEYSAFITVYVALLFLALFMYGLSFWRRDRLRFERRQRSQVSHKFISEFSDATTIAAFSKSKSVDREKIHDFLMGENNKFESHELIHTLNFFERMALSIEADVSDEELLARYFGKFATAHYQQFEWAIVQLRKNTGSDNLFKNYEKLVGYWSFEKRDSV